MRNKLSEITVRMSQRFEIYNSENWFRGLLYHRSLSPFAMNSWFVRLLKEPRSNTFASYNRYKFKTGADWFWLRHIFILSPIAIRLTANTNILLPATILVWRLLQFRRPFVLFAKRNFSTVVNIADSEEPATFYLVLCEERADNLESQQIITVNLQEVEDGSPPPPETRVENRVDTTPSTKSQPPPPPPSTSPSHTVMTGKGKH